MPISLRSVIPVWIVAAVGAVAVGVLIPGSYLSWIPIVMALATLLTFAIQIGVSRKEGLFERIAASLVGALVILALATGVIWLATLSGAN